MLRYFCEVPYYSITSSILVKLPRLLHVYRTMVYWKVIRQQLLLICGPVEKLAVATRFHIFLIPLTVSVFLNLFFCSMLVFSVRLNFVANVGDLRVVYSVYSLHIYECYILNIINLGLMLYGTLTISDVCVILFIVL